MSAIDWPGLVRAGLHGLGLAPEAFWRLTPAELRIMLGAEILEPLSRKRLEQLLIAFPDTLKEASDGPDRRPAGAGKRIGRDFGRLDSAGRGF